MDQFFEAVALVVGYVGMAIIAVSALLAVFYLLSKPKDLETLRKRFGERILTGLEFIIASELLLVTITEDLRDLLNIAVIVGIRAVMGFILKREISS